MTDKAGTFYELRMYRAQPGRRDALVQRFRDHTAGFFAKYDIMLEGFWTTTSGEDAEDGIVFLLSAPSEAEYWARRDRMFHDPDYQRVVQHAEKQVGTAMKLIQSTVKIGMRPTDFSAMG